MKINIFEAIGIVYIGGYTYWLISSVGRLPLNPEEVYDWKMVLVGFVSITVPLVLGYLAGICDRRKW
jgi:hypothetical protein